VAAVHGHETSARWKDVRAELERRVGAQAFTKWLNPMILVAEDDGSATVGLPTRFMRDWVESHFSQDVQAAIRSISPDVTNVAMIVSNPLDTLDMSDTARPDQAPAAATRPVGAPVVPARPATAAAPGSFSGEAGLDPRYTFDSFVVGRPNELAHAAARRVAESREIVFNPLFLYGGVGLGKTHLMHAIAWAIRERDPDRRVLYVSAEKFMYEFVRAVRFKDTFAFKEQFRSVDVLMIDDVQFIATANATQEEFFHTFNELVDRRRQIIISADKSPSDLEGIEERLKSRMNWGLVADIHPASFELRLGILQARVEERAAHVPTDVLEILAHRITSNVRELEGALIRVLAHAQLMDQPVTMDLAESVLANVFRAGERKISIEEIQHAVAHHYKIRVADMKGAKRSRDVARPRQIAMYLARSLTERSFPEIGRLFGKRDHTTVLHAVRTVEKLMGEDMGVRGDVDHLRRHLQS